jgi:hypothetical protein
VVEEDLHASLAVWWWSQQWRKYRFTITVPKDKHH